MNLEFLKTATAKELEQFKAVCNQLLSRTYVVRTLYRPGRGRVSNPDYPFCLSILSPCASISACLTGICGATI